jgi:putative transposase
MKVAGTPRVMPRKRRLLEAHTAYHVLNRAAKRAALFETSGDYQAFETLLGDACERHPMRILAYCLMPNHWHLLLWPQPSQNLTRYVQWLTTTHASRWNRAHRNIGGGAVYQSRFKSIPIQSGPHLLWVWRYVERNALRSNLVRRAEDWRWSSLWQRGAHAETFLDRGPVPLPPDWLDIVNIPQTEAELAVFRHHVAKMQPYGSENWLTTKPPRRGRPPLPIYEKRKKRV